jgi:hypothetical protein
MNDLPADSEYKRIEKNIDNWQRRQSSVLLLANDDITFETQYQTLISEMEKLGIRKLDAKRNEFYQQNCEKSGRVIERVNGDDERD